MGVGCKMKVGLGVHFSRKSLQFGRENGMFILQTHLQSAISNFRPWLEGANKLDIFDIVPKGTPKTFGPPRFTRRIASEAKAKCEVKYTPEPTVMLHLTWAPGATSSHP